MRAVRLFDPWGKSSEGRARRGSLPASLQAGARATRSGVLNTWLACPGFLAFLGLLNHVLPLLSYYAQFAYYYYACYAYYYALRAYYHAYYAYD